jgi:hypothetical protein
VGSNCARNCPVRSCDKESKRNATMISIELYGFFTGIIYYPVFQLGVEEKGKDGAKDKKDGTDREGKLRAKS